MSVSKKYVRNIVTKIKTLYDFEIYKLFKAGIDSMFSMDTLCLKYIVTTRQVNNYTVMI